MLFVFFFVFPVVMAILTILFAHSILWRIEFILRWKLYNRYIIFVLFFFGCFAFRFFAFRFFAQLKSPIIHIYPMNFTTNRANPKVPPTANDPNPQIIPGLPPNIQISMPNNRPIDPEIINKVRSLASQGTTTSTTTGTVRPVNPLRSRSGLWFRDILGRASPSECGSCEGTK
jgi:hypothetical protein